MAPGETTILWWNLQGPGAGRIGSQLDLIRDELDGFPQILAFAEVLQSSLGVLQRRLPDYTVVSPQADLNPGVRRSVLAVRGIAEQLGIERFTIPSQHPVRQARGFSVWPRSIVSARAQVAGAEVDLHAVHIPNGKSNGWDKIDHLWALRRGLEGADRAQIVAGDFNAPQTERGEEIISFGQRLDGTYSTWTSTKPPYSPERPWEAKAWDAGERAVLEGLPEALDTPDAFRQCHPDLPGFTWGPRGAGPDRRLDHVFISSKLGLLSCDHLDQWRRHELSDHCPILVRL